MAKKTLAERIGTQAGVEADLRVKMLMRENADMRRKLAEKDANRDILQGVLLNVFGNLEPLVVREPPAQPKRNHAEEAVLHICDTHFGKRTMTYGMAIAEERIVQVGERTQQLTELRRANAKIDHLHLYLGGDMGEGEGEIFPGQSHEIDADVIAQSCRERPRIISELVFSLLQTFKQITIAGVPGNHGRTARAAAKRNNFDNWFYDVLRLMVDKHLRPKDRQRISWNLPIDRPNGQEWWAHDIVANRWGCLLIHGDQIRGSLGMPWYGIGKKAYGWIDTVPHSWNYLFLGHFHTLCRTEMNGRTVLANGTTESANAYAAEQLAAGGEPLQRLCFFDERHGLISDDPLYLSERKPNR